MIVKRAVVATLIGVVAGVSAAEAGDGCRYPFVWREAFAGDHVCVTPDTRSRAAYDNSAAADRINPDNHDYGPDTCRYGFVWREASASDHVCVTPDTRTRAARDNAAAPGRSAAAVAARSSRPTRVEQAGCCPNSMLVCPLGRHFCP